MKVLLGLSSGDYMMKEITSWFGVKNPTVSHAVKSMKCLIARPDPEVSKQV